MYESEDKMVSHPDHYISETGMEVIDVIEAFTFDLKGIEATDTANIIKYACRWKEEKRNSGFGENPLVHTASD
ncbi:MAG: DUF3310 domain-containing protein [Blautia obeum]